jgi:hypothetical protein
LDSVQLEWNFCNFYYEPDTQLYGRILNGYYWLSGAFDAHQYAYYVAGLGLINFEYAQSDGIGGETQLDTTLIYYSKGTEKWGTPYTEFVTGINEPPNTSAIRIYPNPTNNIFFIEAGEPISKVEIMDISGRVVQTQTDLKSKIEVNSSNLSKGIYFCKIYFAEQVVTKKLVVN